MSRPAELPPELERILREVQRPLEAKLRREAGMAILRHESVSDLLQGVWVQVLEAAAEFEYRSDAETAAWIYRVARNYLSTRRKYWNALKRHSADVIRLGAKSEEQDLEAVHVGAGPSTFAQRREELVLVTRAMALLLPRDRDLVEWSVEGLSIDDQATRLGISYNAAERARLRAFERLRKTYEIVCRRIRRRTPTPPSSERG